MPRLRTRLNLREGFWPRPETLGRMAIEQAQSALGESLWSTLSKHCSNSFSCGCDDCTRGLSEHSFLRKKSSTSRNRSSSTRSRVSSPAPDESTGSSGSSTTTYYEPSLCYDTDDIDSAEDARAHEVPCCDESCVTGRCLDPTSSLCTGDYMMEPPNGWSTRCEIKGKASECTAYLHERSLEEFLSMDVDSVFDLEDYSAGGDGNGLFKLSGDEGIDIFSTNVDLISYAWALMLENTDLVKWAVCWVTGRPSKGDCLVRRIEGKGKRVTIHFTDAAGDDDTDGESAGADIWGRRIVIYRGSIFWTSFHDAYWFSTSKEEWLCAAISVASVLLHELTHICLRSLDDGDPERTECFDAYGIQHTFHYALTRRYPDSQVLDCCSTDAEDAFGERHAGASPYPVCFT